MGLIHSRNICKEVDLFQLTPRRIITRRRTTNKRRSREILPMFDAILVMKRETLQETVPSRKGDTILMLLKIMNQ